MEETHINSYINNYYLKLQKDAKNKVAYYESILNNNEEYVDTINRIGKINFEISKLKYNDKNIDNSLINNLNLLNEKINKIYDKLGINKEFLIPKYKCKLCNDTGFVDNKRCLCYYNYLHKFTFKLLNIEEAKLNSFDDSKKINELEKHYNLLKEYSSKFPTTNVFNFVFTGKPGTGKTHLAKCVANEIKNKNYLSVYLTASELNNLLVKTNITVNDKTNLYNLLTNCDFLVIDDLGTEQIFNNITIEGLLTIISERLEKNKHFIITTNLTNEEIKNRYNERLFSRLMDKTKTKFIEFKTNDLRITK